MKRTVAICAAALLIAGCGGNDKTDPTTAPSSTTTTAPLNGAQIAGNAAMSFCLLGMTPAEAGAELDKMGERDGLDPEWVRYGKQAHRRMWDSGSC